MLPKVEACLQFVRNHKEGQAVITSLANAGNALKGGNSTVITANYSTALTVNAAQVSKVLFAAACLSVCFRYSG